MSPRVCWRKTLCLSLFVALLCYQGGLSSAPSLAAASRGVSTQPATPQTTAIYAEAYRILAGAHATTYTHKTHVDEGLGEFDLDCSGLCRYILRRILPEHLAVVVQESKRSVPRSVEFCDFFRDRQLHGPQKTGWTTVPRLMDARGGDMIAWRKDKIVPHESTGHMMIVVEPPQAEADNLVRVRVIDSSTTAVEGSTQPVKGTGVSLRTRYFRVDAQGAAEYCNSHQRPQGGTVMIGRAIAVSAPSK